MLDPGPTTSDIVEVFSPAARVAPMLGVDGALTMGLADVPFVVLPTAETSPPHPGSP